MSKKVIVKNGNFSVVSEGKGRPRLEVRSVFHADGTHPFDEVEWDKRDVEISDEHGKVIFCQKDVEAPKGWSDTAVKVVVSKYFYGELGTPERETSIKQLLNRVCRTIAKWGVEDGYFDEYEGDKFYRELLWLCLNQYGSFNSPVWFNVGLYEAYKVGRDSAAGNWVYDTGSDTVKRAETQYVSPQCSACFIQSVEDNMESIMGLVQSEAMLFKFGSGTGTDLSTIRSSREKLSGGGRPSGPMSFLKVYDQVANVVKSGGKTRRAAKMNTLCDWHGDIEEFINAKRIEEKKVRALVAQGYDGSFNGEAYSSAMYQNENLSVRISDKFMYALDGDGVWETKAVTTGETLEKKDARVLFTQIAEGTWECGDPGVQFDDRIQEWHTCKASGRINSSNPCSEYLFLDNTSCNLSSLNLCKFINPMHKYKFSLREFESAIYLFIIAQEILVDRASYPTKQIAQNTHDFRSLGLGFANLGALLMRFGLPYDSHEARQVASKIASTMTAVSYYTSYLLAEVKGPFAMYKKNKKSFAQVMHSHKRAYECIVDEKGLKDYFFHLDDNDSGESNNGSQRVNWDLVCKLVDNRKCVGFRNAQTTVLAPTGTISFMMDCSTTGVEPEMAIVKYKFLVGGGMLKMVNTCVKWALYRLGYGSSDINDILSYIEKYDTLETVVVDGKEVTNPLKPEHLAVFDCAFIPANGKRCIDTYGHLKMMAAIQPFISGAISKTVNMPSTATVEDIARAYKTAWELGLKCVAIYRDGSKSAQPVRTSKEGGSAGGSKVDACNEELQNRITELEKTLSELKRNLGKPVRHRLPATRGALNHKFEIAGHEGYLTVGLYEDGQPGELFITMAKVGSTIAGLMDSLATLTSLTLQYGVPLSDLVRKFAHQRFEPWGLTGNPEIRSATSIVDYVFRWMELKFLGSCDGSGIGKGVVTEFVNTEEVSNPCQPTVNAVRHVIWGEKVEEGSMEANDKGVSLSAVLRGFQSDAPLCPYCGQTTVRNGACYKCLNCGESLGCS